MSEFFRISAVCGSIILSVIGVSSVARAQLSDKTIKIVVPYAPGGGVDITARMMATKLSETFKQSVIVENRPGADGMIAARAVANSEPDGHTILIDSPGVVMNPSRFKKPLYDPMKELTPVALLIKQPYVVLINANIPATDIKGLVAYLKNNPGRVNVATQGATGQLVGELFKSTAQVDISFIPFRGDAPALTATIAGDTQMMFSNITSAVPQLSGGRLRALAVTSDERAPMLPGVPTTKEAGMPAYVVTSWHGSYAAAGTPAEVVHKLNTAFNQALMQPEIVAKFAVSGSQPAPTSVEAFNRFYREEYKRWKDVISSAKTPLVE